MYNIGGNVLINGDIENTGKLLTGVKEYDVALIKIKSLSMGLGEVVDIKYKEVIQEQIGSAFSLLKETGVLIIQFSNGEDAESFINTGELDKICVERIVVRDTTFLVYAKSVWFYGYKTLSVQEVIKKQFHKSKDRTKPQKQQKINDTVETSIWVSPVEKMLKSNWANYDNDREDKSAIFSDKEVYLLQYLKEIGSKNIEIIDFDGGCPDTASVIMKMNKEDNGKRKFTLVSTDRYSITPAVNRSLLEKEVKKYKEVFEYIVIK